MTLSIEKLLSIPKSFYISCKYFPLVKALRLPILMRYNCKILSTSGVINVIGGGKTGVIKFGFGDVGIYDKKYERSIWQVSGELVVRGKAQFGHGSRLCVGGNGVLELGLNFTNYAACTIVCMDKITIGRDFLGAWNTLIMDTDFHQIECTEMPTVLPITKPITIEDNVWVGTRAVVLKGSSLPSNCIVGAMAVVSGVFSEENTVIAGNPARIVKRNVRRKI